MRGAYIFMLIVAAAAPASAADELRVGLFTELSGTFAASAGTHCQHGYELARTLYAPKDVLPGGRRVRFIYGDTRGDAKTALSEFSKLLDVEKAHVLVSNRTQVGMALSPIAARRRFPIVAVMGGAKITSASPYNFQFYPNAQFEGEALAAKMLALGVKRAAAVSLLDEWYLSFSESFRRGFLTGGGTLVLDQEVIEGETDFDALAASIRPLAPDGILVNAGPTQCGPLIRKLRAQGVQSPLFGNYYSRSQEVLENAGAEGLEGMLTVEMSLRKPEFERINQDRYPGVLVNPLT